MSRGWHKQRALENAAFRAPRKESKPAPSLEEEITTLERHAAQLRPGGPAHALVMRQLKHALARKEARAALQKDT